MDEQQDIELINDKLYSLDIPNEPIKNIMFYFIILNEIIDFPFPENYLNYEHPYFNSYSEMEEFLALAFTFNPKTLHQHNVIIYYNEKKYYKYYRVNPEKNKGIPYEFKIIDKEESLNPLFEDNYKNTFNISNIDKKETEFEIEIPNKVEFLHSENDSEDTIEEHYVHEEEEDNNQYEVDENDHNGDSIGNINEYEYDEYEENDKKTSYHYKDIRKFYDEYDVNNHHNASKVGYKNQLFDSENELEDEIDDVFNEIKYSIQKVEIINRLVVTNNWIDYIYNNQIKNLLFNMKTVIKSDVIREKSISLPRNVFFYLTVIFLVLMGCCASTLLSWCSTLKKDYRFVAYQGNVTQGNNKKRPNNSNFLDENITEIDYYNDTVIVPEFKKYKKIHKGCQLGETSGVFGLFFIVFIIYMTIRIAREKKKKYQSKEKRRKVGLNMCHIIIFVLLTLLAFILTLVAEIYICISIAQKTYQFIHVSVRTQLILNSIMFVTYILIILFYFKI